jgi:hypothetical protein
MTHYIENTSIMITLGLRVTSNRLSPLKLWLEIACLLALFIPFIHCTFEAKSEGRLALCLH